MKKQLCILILSLAALATAHATGRGNNEDNGPSADASAAAISASSAVSGAHATGVGHGGDAQAYSGGNKLTNEGNNAAQPTPTKSDAVNAARLRELIEDAADEYSRYIVEDTAPITLSTYMLNAFDAAMLAANQEKRS